MTYRSPRGDVRSVWIVDVRPELDGGRFPVKREVGDMFEVSADILQEGHGNLAAVLRYRTVKDTAWHEAPMEPLGNDRWAGRFLLEETTRYVYTIEAWPDAYRAWAEDLRKRVGAGMDVASELLEGAALLARRPRARGGRRSAPARGEARRVRGSERRGPARPSPPQRGGRGDPRRPSRPRGGDAIRPRARGRRRPAAGPVRRVVRAVPTLSGPRARPARHLPTTASSGCRRSPRWASMCSTCRRSIRSADASARAETTRCMAGPDDPGQPLGHRRRAGRAQGDRPRARHARRLRPFVRACREHGHRDRARLRPPVLAGSSLGAGAPEWFPPAGRHDQVRGEPAEEVPGHLSRQLRRTRPRGALAGAAASVVLLLDRAGRADLPRRQSAHQADPVLGVADRARSSTITPT